ncbi:S8 family serine peptidase [Pontiellaceae bacterium B12227]|nr:S8 family serine peptidase [Pontiellaceae bacterium B12227]
MGKSRWLPGFQRLEIVVLCTFFAASTVLAQPHKTFAERPQKRAQKAEEARIRADRERYYAREWARSRGYAMRHDDGKRVMELMAVQDGRPLILTTMNEDAAISTAADGVRNATPFNVNGSGVRVGIWDGGTVMTNHQEFATRIQAEDVTNPHYHATHVGGTIAAAGVSARSEGMAPQAQLVSYDWESNHAEMIAVAAAAPDDPAGIYVSNHSYGILAGWFYASWLNPYTRRSGYHWWGDLTTDTADEYFGQYGSGTRYWDEIVYDAPYFLLFKAAGNERNDNPTDGAKVYYTPDGGDSWTNTIFDAAIHPLGDGQIKNGYDTIPYYGNAKNIITIGAVSDAVVNGSRAITNAVPLEFTSWGPADDGRVKPDLVANGQELYSCNVSSTNSYASRSGTSMACPNATGSAALLIDYYDDLFPEQAMRASTLKGLILHTADDLGRPGPDYQYGWGLMNTRAAAELIQNLDEGNGIRMTEDLLSDSGSLAMLYECYVDGSEPLRVSLCWTDPPGPANSLLDSRTPVLVNDLDLKVIGPGGEYFPYRLRYADPEAVALTNDKNSVDNIEQVFIEFPMPGTYTVSVTVDGALTDGEQHYSLLTSGAVSDLDGDGLPDYWENSFFLNPTGSLATADADGDGVDNLGEYISGSDPMDPDSVFGFTSVETVAATGHPPFVVKWDALPGRVYNVYRTYHLIYVPFEPVSGDIRWPANSYTDTVDRIGEAGLYKVDVRMENGL